MKNALFLALFCLCSTTMLAQVSFGESTKVNDNWKFHKGDVEKAALSDFDDSKWIELDLPHDWSAKGPLSPSLASGTGYLPGGIAWYRKKLDIPADKKNKKVFIYFEGVYCNAEVFINGVSVGKRPNGYISYMYELTPHIKFEGENKISVKVDHSKYADSRWYTGSGIYRDVYLVYSNSIHIDQWGVHCTTIAATEKQARVKIETSVNNTTNKEETLTVTHEIRNNGNKTIGKSSKKLNIQAGNVQSINQEININNPLLWSLNSPNLYKLHTSVYLGNQLIDQAVQTMGIRMLGFDANKGFSLNGKSMKVKGVCLHHDAGTLGAAVPTEVWERRLATLKSLGCNAIRTSHNPQAPTLYDLCDELGILILNEAFDEWEFPKKKWIEGWNVGTPGFDGYAEHFNEWGETDLKDMVLRDRHHPSIFMWSIGNEVDYPNDPYSHPILDKEGIQQQHSSGYKPDQPHAERLGSIAKRLAAVVKKYDTSRPVTAGLAGPVMSNETEYPGALDVAGYNYTERRYAQDHAKYPKRILYGSENGHSMDAWKAVRDNEYVFGQFIWTGIDYLGEARSWPSRGFNSGMLDLAGYKKARAYFRESLWSDKPMVYVGSYQPQKRDRGLSIDAPAMWNYQTGDTIRVVSYTNCEKGQLLLNGQKIGEPKNYDDQTGVIFWDIPYKEGKLEVIGYKAGKEVARNFIESSKRPYAIQAKVLNTISSERRVAQIEIQIVDEDGKPVFLADQEVTCSINGPSKLLGLEAGSPHDMGDYTDDKHRVYQGTMIAYVQSTETPGKTSVTFSSPWLKDAVVELEHD